MNTSPQQPDLTAIIYRLESVERDIKRVTDQLPQYVPVRENDLKLQSVQDTVKRIETDVGKAKDELVTLNTKLAQQEQAAQQRDNQQREDQAKLVIATLKWAVGLVVSGLLLLLGAYFTHLIH